MVRVIALTTDGDAGATLAEGGWNSSNGVSVDASELSFEHETAGQWWLTAQQPDVIRYGLPVAVPLRDTPGGDRWAFTTLGRRWATQGCAELVVGGALLPASTAQRSPLIVVIELGVQNSDEPAGVKDAAVVQSVLPLLVARAQMAYINAGSDTAAETLTVREHEVLELLAMGRTVKQIAETLSRSPHTVHDHVKSLHRKLGASSRGELVARALGHIEAGAVEPMVLASK